MGDTPCNCGGQGLGLNGFHYPGAVGCLRTTPPTDTPRPPLTTAILQFCAEAPIGEVQLLHRLAQRITRGRDTLAQATQANGDQALGTAHRAALLDLYVLDTLTTAEDV